MPEKPKIRSKEDIDREQRAKENAGKIAFDMDKEYDLSNYKGRFTFHFDRVNPLLFFVSKKRIQQARDENLKFQLRAEASKKIGSEVFLTPEEIKRVKKNWLIVGSAVHPDTNEVTPIWFRLSSFVTFNVPLVLIMLFYRNQTPQFNAFMQWVNQTYNAGMNYGNRNASSPYTSKDLLRGYCGAVATSVSISYFLRTYLSKHISSLKGSRLILMNAALNYFVAALAGASNLGLMRQKEWVDGIIVSNKDGSVEYGKSKKAGKKAILETAFTRSLLPLPVLFLPATGNFLLEKIGLWPKRLYAGKMMELMLVTFSLTIALPMSIALFEQQAVLDRSRIDEHLQNLPKAKFERNFEISETAIEGDKKETPKKVEKKEEKVEEVELKEEDYVQHFYFNKGL
mmetsp:Transcript_4390/g.6360  ORF Transcript_4390/g.6360 Transcript_4390/m.6360 type:complete len:398 (-) Transcript_4390:19-1212(-)